MAWVGRTHIIGFCGGYRNALDLFAESREVLTYGNLSKGSDQIKQHIKVN